jgi:hypothetical protein
MASFAAFGGILFGYDTGTIGGIIAMDDWLKAFGTYDATGTLGLATNGYYLPANDKSLVVSILSAGTFFGALIPSLLLSFYPPSLLLSQWLEVQEDQAAVSLPRA